MEISWTSEVMYVKCQMLVIRAEEIYAQAKSWSCVTVYPYILLASLYGWKDLNENNFRWEPQLNLYVSALMSTNRPWAKRLDSNLLIKL
jgi:hypothetical protein